VQEDKEPTPSAAIIDSQSVKSSMNKGVHGFDGAKNVNGLWDDFGFLILPKELLIVT
jgi:hypothetical protein